MMFLLILWIGGYVLFIANTLNISALDTNNKTQAIIVLTGGNNRIQTGLKLWQDNISDNLFITGVHPSVKKSDIISMWNGNEPLPKCCLTLGHKATTTRENAVETKAWIEKQNINDIKLVTSNYHITRALLEFKHIMPEVNITTNSVTEKTSPLKNYNFWKISFLEYHKFMFRYLIITLNEKFQ